MKILFLTPRESKTNLGGVERHVRLLTEELVRRGHQVKELSLGKTDKSYKDYKYYRRFKESPCHAARRHLFKFLAWKLLWENRRFIRQADIIHIHDIFWWYLPFRFLFLRKPVFTTFHGWEGRYPPTRSAVWQKRLAAFLSDGTIGVGSFFEKWYGVKTDRVVWGAIDKSYKGYKDYKDGEKGEKEQKDEKEKGKTVFFGRLEEVNGIEIVIEAAERLNKGYKGYKNYKENDDNHLVFFVGDGTFRKQAERVGRVTGMVENPWKYLVGAEVVIASSYLAILEAAALGKRIIAVADNPLKRDYLEGHPLRGYFKVVGSAEKLVGEITDKSYKDYKDYKEREKGEKDQKDEKGEGKAGEGNTWALGQTAEKLGDEYEELWRIKQIR